MRDANRVLHLLPALLLAAVFAVDAPARAQLVSWTDVNQSKKTGDDTECAIAKNPTNKLQLFAFCNSAGAGLFAARSTDGGQTWVYPDAADKTIADGDANQGTAACCDPTATWDTFGNLFLSYIDSSLTTIVILLSTDGGQTFNNLTSFTSCTQCVDQPTIVAADTTAPGAPVAVWIVWSQFTTLSMPGQMVARGAAVTGSGVANVGAFGAQQTIPGTTNCSYGDVAIAPDGVVVQACGTQATGGQGPANILVNTDADGLGPGNFGAAVTASATNVGGFDFIPAQNSRSVDAEAGLAYDRNPMSPHFGRVYLVYTDEVTNESNDTDVMLRFSDNNGGIWSAPIRVNDDPATPIRSQFLPKIASNPLSGNIAICWHDARNSATNTAMQEFCTIANRDDFPVFIGPNLQVGDGASTSNGAGVEFGDYSGLAYHTGIAHPIWADTSNSTGDNPNTNANFDAYGDRVWGGAAANEGDPHLTTVDGVHYDFQSAGEFVALRDPGGLEIQTRQTAVPSASTIGPNAYTGLTTCVSINTAVAARVNGRRLSFQPNLSGQPDPSGLQLRIDGSLTTLGPQGLDLGSGARVVKSAVGGIEVDFPDGSLMVVTPGFWTSQGKWYMNVNVYRTPATEGIMGSLAPGSWLPALSDGGSLGPKPASNHDRYVALYEKFADSWRVTASTSLFEYAPGTSTATFTVDAWPLENPPCVLPEQTPVEPMPAARAQELCRAVTGKNRNADCVFDVTLTGEPGFAKTYLLTQRFEAGATTTTVSDDKDPTAAGEPAVFTAVVRRKLSSGRGSPTGTVVFSVDGKRHGAPVALDENGRATWRTSRLQPGRHKVSARYEPGKGSTFFESSSREEEHVVSKKGGLY